MNGRFYRGSATVFCSLRGIRFSSAISRASKIAKVHNRMLIKILLFDDSGVFFAQGTQES